jgi:hypothetical protein
MAQDKKGFILYADLITVIEKLVLKDRENKTNFAGELFYHILLYVNDENPIPIDFIVELSFESIKQQLKRDLEKYQKTKEGYSKAGKASAEARRLKKLNVTQQDSTSLNDVKNVATIPTVIVNDTVIVNVKDNVILKITEKETLILKYKQKGYEWMINKLSNYKLSHGKKYKSDYGAINSWVVKEWLKENKKASSGTSNLVF